MPTAFPDDTDLDALAARVRTAPLTASQIDDLLDQARGETPSEAQEQLVTNELPSALDAALRKRGQGVEIADLVQEATLAVVAAIATYVDGTGDAAGLRTFVTDAIEVHLIDAIIRHKKIKDSDHAIVEDAQLLSAARVHLRAQLEREPEDQEIISLLHWEKPRFEAVNGALTEAQIEHDVDLLRYLDDLED